MTQSLEPEGDYGYDLVHQEVVAARPVAPRPTAEHRTPAPVSGGHDLADDLAYDEAHDF